MRLAARGARETETGTAAIGDTWLVGQLQGQAREVHVRALALAMGLTGLLLLLPSPVA